MREKSKKKKKVSVTKILLLFCFCFIVSFIVFYYFFFPSTPKSIGTKKKIKPKKPKPKRVHVEKEPESVAKKIQNPFIISPKIMFYIHIATLQRFEDLERSWLKDLPAGSSFKTFSGLTASADVFMEGFDNYGKKKDCVLLQYWIADFCNNYALNPNIDPRDQYDLLCKSDDDSFFEMGAFYTQLRNNYEFPSTTGYSKDPILHIGCGVMLSKFGNIYCISKRIYDVMCAQKSYLYPYHYIHEDSCFSLFLKMTLERMEYPLKTFMSLNSPNLKGSYHDGYCSMLKPWQTGYFHGYYVDKDTAKIDYVDELYNTDITVHHGYKNTQRMEYVYANTHGLVEIPKKVSFGIMKENVLWTLYYRQKRMKGFVMREANPVKYLNDTLLIHRNPRGRKQQFQLIHDYYKLISDAFQYKFDDPFGCLVYKSEMKDFVWWYNYVINEKDDDMSHLLRVMFQILLDGGIYVYDHDDIMTYDMNAVIKYCKENKRNTFFFIDNEGKVRMMGATYYSKPMFLLLRDFQLMDPSLKRNEKEMILYYFENFRYSFRERTVIFDDVEMEKFQWKWT